MMSIFGRRQHDEEPQPHEDTDIPQRPITQGQVVGFQTVLGSGTTLDGTLKSQGNMRIDGNFTGTLEIEGNILVGEDSEIHADIEARNISIAGNVHGNVTGKRVQLLRTACVWGDIDAVSLTMEEGAFIDGKIVMKNRPKQSGKPTQSTPIVMLPEVENPDEPPKTMPPVSPSMIEPPVT